MATVKITINGVICDLYGRTITGPVKIVGEAMYTDLGVGGGPIFPEAPPDSGLRPEHPIVLPPADPPHPAHPIVLPDPPTGGPPVDPPTNPSDPTWVWGWNRVQGWHPVYVPGPSDPAPH